MKIKFQPPSATDLPPHNPILPPAAITQVILLANPNKVTWFSLFVSVTFSNRRNFCCLFILNVKIVYFKVQCVYMCLYEFHFELNVTNVFIFCVFCFISLVPVKYHAIQND